MDIWLIIFLILATLSISGAVFMLTLERWQYQAYAIGLTFLCAAVLFLIQRSLPLFILQIVIHVGLWMVLVPFFQHLRREERKPHDVSQGLAFFLIAAFLAVFIWQAYQIPSLSNDMIRFSFTDLLRTIDMHYLISLILILLLQLLGFIRLFYVHRKGEE